MKTLISILVLVLIVNNLHAQNESPIAQDSVRKMVVVVKNDGTEYQGYIVSKDARELLLDVQEPLGQIFIPMHEVKEIRESNSKLQSSNHLFATRYFLTTNGLAMPKGSKYALLNYYGPEAHFAVADDFTLGLMTSWFAIPLIGSAKYSFHFSEKVHMSIGTLIGTLSWIKADAAGFLPYGAFTVGNYENNINVSVGYLGVTFDGDRTGAPLLSVAGLVRLGKNVHFVGDSFIYLGDNSFAILIPGIRFERPFRRSSIQVGLGGVIFDGQAIPLPVPLFSWFYDL